MVGANDIESNFSSSQSQAQDWESAYLAATTASLVFAGSATACPSSYGTTNTNCQPVRDDNGVTKTWSQQQYYALAGGLNPTRIQAIPQIYNADMAVQWANIHATGGGKIHFLGALTAHAAEPSTLAPEHGWAALYDALSTVVSTPSLPAVTDLQVDD